MQNWLESYFDIKKGGLIKTFSNPFGLPGPTCTTQAEISGTLSNTFNHILTTFSSASLVKANDAMVFFCPLTAERLTGVPSICRACRKWFNYLFFWREIARLWHLLAEPQQFQGLRQMNDEQQLFFFFLLFQGRPYRFIDLWQIDCWSGKRCTLAKMQTTTKTLARCWRTKDSGEFRKVSIRRGCPSSTSSVIEYSQTPVKQTKTVLKSALELNHRRKRGACTVFQGNSLNFWQSPSQGRPTRRHYEHTVQRAGCGWPWPTYGHVAVNASVSSGQIAQIEKWALQFHTLDGGFVVGVGVRGGAIHRVSRFNHNFRSPQS